MTRGAKASETRCILAFLEHKTLPIAFTCNTLARVEHETDQTI